MNVPRFWKLINMISKKVFNLHELISENGKWILASHWLNQQVMRMQHPYSPDLHASRERLWIHVLFTQSNEKMCSSDTEKHKFSHSHFRTKPDPEAIRQSNYGQFARKKKKQKQCSNTSISNIHTLSYLRNILARHSPDKYFLSSIHLRILMGTQEPFVPWTVFIILPLSMTIHPKEGLCFAGSKQGLTCMAHHHEVNKQKNIEKEKKGKWRKLPPIFTKNYN